MGLLRASFVPPRAIRDLRDYTRARTRLVQERTRCWQRLEKLLEGAQVKLSSVASKLTAVSAQDMIRAMIAGQRDPRVLAALARPWMKASPRPRSPSPAPSWSSSHLLSDPAARYTDLGPGYYQDRIDKDRKLKNHIRQIEALGFTVALNKTA